MLNRVKHEKSFITLGPKFSLFAPAQAFPQAYFSLTDTLTADSSSLYTATKCIKLGTSLHFRYFNLHEQLKFYA